MEKYSRQEFLKKSSLLGLSAFGVAILAACGGAESNGSEEAAVTESKPKPEGLYSKKDEVMEVPEVDCSEYNAELTEADLSTRNSVEYIEKSNVPYKMCTNCQFWQPDKFEGECGGCQLFVNGAVSPGGYCNSWAKKAS